MAESGTIGAVISGDLVLSGELSSAVRKAVPSRLREIAGDLAGYSSTTISKIDLFRGDSWQLIVDDPSIALRVAMSLRLSLITWHPDADTRAVIGIGRIESRGGSRVSSGYGEAFTQSGRTLDDLASDRRLAIAVDSNDATGELLDAGAHLLDRISREWTTAQSRAVIGAMNGKSQDEIGSTWAGGPISQQAVAQHLQRASWHAVNHWLGTFEAYIQQVYPRI